MRRCRNPTPRRHSWIIPRVGKDTTALQAQLPEAVLAVSAAKQRGCYIDLEGDTVAEPTLISRCQARRPFDSRVST